jgi:hypothetical protein
VGFFGPEVAGIGAALLVALVATYLLKPSRPTRRVSSTFLWLAAFHELQTDRPWRRVPPSLLLLLQLLALAALIAALARPYVLSVDAASLDSIVVIDVSAATQATDVPPTRFVAERARVSEMIDALTPGQTMSLVSLGDEPRVLAPRTDDRAVLHRALDTLQPTLQSTNLPAALSLAASLAEGHPEAQVVVVASGALDRSQVPGGFPLALRFVGIGTAADNMAIAAFGTRLVDGHLTALARVANYAPRSRSASLNLRVDGARFDTRVLTIEPGGTADAEWDDLPVGGRLFEAHLVESDALEVDNTAWSVAGGDRPTRVLLVSSGNVFLERGLALRSGVQVTRTGPSGYAADGLGAQPFDLFVFDGLLPPDLPATGSLLVIHPPAGNSFVRTGPDVPISRLDAVHSDHSLLTDVSLAGVHVSRARQLDVPAWADSVLESPETPLLLLGEQAGHRVGVLGFDVHDSDLPLQPAFPILVQHLLDWLVPGGSIATPVVRVGEAAQLVPLPEAQNVDVIPPDGLPVRVAPPFPTAPFAETTAPGIYQVVQRDGAGNETRSQFAANFIDPGQSHLRAGETAVVGPGAANVRPANALAGPREIWQIAAVTALALLAVEWWAYQRQ